MIRAILRHIGLFIVLLIDIFGDVKAESIKQCFHLNNLPNRSIQSFLIQEAELKDKVIHNSLKNKNEISNSIFSSLREEHVSVLLQEITNGSGISLVYREQFQGWPSLTDTSTIQYLTVYIPGILSKNRTIDISKEKDVLVVLTEGVPSFRNFCFGYAKKGKISIQISNGYDNEFMNKISDPIFHVIGKDAVVMDIDITVTMKNTNEAWQEQCGICTLQGKLVFSKSSLNSMNN